MASQSAKSRAHVHYPTSSNNERRLAISLVIAVGSLILFLALANCAGGGSAGTGLKVFTGQVVATDGSPLAGVEISVVDTGDAVLTQDDGNFQIETEIGGGDIQVNITSQGVISSVTLTELPEGDAAVGLSLQVNKDTNEVESVDVTITPSNESSEGSAEDEESDVDDGSDDAHDSDSADDGESVEEEDNTSDGEMDFENGEDGENVEGEEGEVPDETPPSAGEEEEEFSEGEDSHDNTEEEEISDEDGSPDDIDPELGT